jgi:hypothetical protein
LSGGSFEIRAFNSFLSKQNQKVLFIKQLNKGNYMKQLKSEILVLGAGFWGKGSKISEAKYNCPERVTNKKYYQIWIVPEGAFVNSSGNIATGLCKEPFIPVLIEENHVK